MSISRRRFLQGSAAAAGVSILNLTSLPAFANLLNSCDDGSYKALVGIDFAGGNDGFNMIIPQQSNIHQDYKDLRGNLHIAKGLGEALSDEFNLNPALQAMIDLWDKKELIPILNVGPLVLPKKASELNDDNKPAHLFSHNHQSAMVQSSARTSLNKNGFGANAETLFDDAPRGFENYSALFDIGGGQTWTNNMTIQSNPVGKSAPNDIFLSNDNKDNNLFDAIQNADNYSNLLQKHYAKIATGAPDTHEKMSKIFDTSIGGSIEFPNTSIGEQLEAVLKLILNRARFGHNRQYFSCKLGGFDTHSNQLQAQTKLLEEYSEAITVFHQALRAHSLADSVTSFSHSEFGRTLEPNANGGTDHGWGSHSFVIGGALDGMKVYGQYPDLTASSDYLLSRGRVVPTISTDQIHATLLTWLGLKESNITDLFPSLANDGSDGSDGFESKTLDLFKCS